MAVDIDCRNVATSWARADPSSRTWQAVPMRYPLVRCLSNPSEVSKCFPQASHTVPRARRALLCAGTSTINSAMTGSKQQTKSRKIQTLKPSRIWQNGESPFQVAAPHFCSTPKFNEYKFKEVQHKKIMEMLCIFAENTGNALIANDKSENVGTNCQNAGLGGPA